MLGTQILNWEWLFLLPAITLAAALARGLRTADIKSEGATVVSTAQMGEAVVGELERIAA